MRFIILGGTGYLGSRVIKELINRGEHQILCLKRESSSLENLEDILDYVEFCNTDALREFLKKQEEPYECFLNMSCRYPRHAATDMDIYQANLVAPLEAFLACVDYGVRRFILVGTGLSDEFNTYTVSKRKLAELCKWHGEGCCEKGIPLQICNVELENFYGEGEPLDRFIPGTIDRLKRNERILLTEGDQKRDFIYVGDVVRNLVELAARTNLPEYLDLPLGTGEGVAVRELIEYLKVLTGSCSKLCFGAIPKRLHEQDSVADCKKMRELGLTVEFSWKDGLKKII